MAYKFEDIETVNALTHASVHDAAEQFARSFLTGDRLERLIDIGYTLAEHQDEDTVALPNGVELDRVPGFHSDEMGMWIVAPLYDETLRERVDPITYYGLGNFLQYIGRCIEAGLL